MDGITIANALKATQAGLTSAVPTAAQTVMLFNADGTPAGKYPAQQLVQDMAKAGLGYGSCTTDATTVAKTVSISNFILIKYGIVSVLFTKAINVAEATLNVNSTGAKPIKVNGAAIQPGLVKANTIVQFQYDGTNWNVVGMFGLEGSDSPSDLWVDMGLPSGLKWATRNIDITQPDGFAASPFQYECSFFSWGNSQGHNPSSTSAFSYNWGTDNTGPYASTPGAALTAQVPAPMDAARVNLGAPWRMPTTNEYKELFDNISHIDAAGDAVTGTNKLVTVNSVVGIRIKSNINGNILFFPCSGYGNGTSWYNRGSYGIYWSASLGSAAQGRYLVFNSGGVYPQNNSNRFGGFAVRAVQ